jgi:two-component system, response regulator
VVNELVEVLIVEDNPDDEELIMLALQKHNLANDLHVVRDGAEALDYVFGQGQYEGRDIHATPRIILLDLKLPKVDGLQVLREIKSDERTKRIPVIVITTSREERDIVESYDLGVNSYMVKPVDFHQFTDAVKHMGFYWLLLNQPPPY